jgi:hypothetical protein
MVLAKPLPDTLGVIGFVTTHSPWSSLHPSLRAAHLHAVNESLELCRFVGLARQQERLEWQTVAINQNVKLGAKSTT